MHKTEKKFYDAYRSNGGRLRKSTPKGDIEWHVDFWDMDTNEAFDVKEAKAVSRGDWRQYALVLLEWTNVHGNVGWLRGRADTIAFESEDGFVLASRKELVGIVQHIDWETTSSYTPKGVPYQRYDRAYCGRKDAFCWVPFVDILSLPSTRELKSV